MLNAYISGRMILCPLLRIS